MEARHFQKQKKFLYTEPELSHQLLQKITDSTINYLKAQVTAGADMLQLFDSWAGVLSPDQYDQFALNILRRSVMQLRMFLSPYLLKTHTLPVKKWAG